MKIYQLLSMKTPLILGFLLLFAPVVSAGTELMKDSFPGTLHFRDVSDVPDSEYTKDSYLPISTIGAVTLVSQQVNGKPRHEVRILFRTMRDTGRNTAEPISYSLVFQNKEEAENLMTRIFTLMEMERKR